MSFELITNDHLSKIITILDNTQNEINMVSPFIKKEMTKRLCEVINRKKIKCTVITRFYVDDFMKNVSDLEALSMLLDCGAKIYMLKHLHTKLYLFDDNCSLLGSANFTQGGFLFNHELSICIKDDDEEIEYMQEYFDNLEQEILKQGRVGILTKEFLNEQIEVINEKKKKTKKGQKITIPKRYGAQIDNEEKDNNKETDSNQNMFTVKKKREFEGIKYFLKPMGSAESPYEEGQPCYESKLRFSKRYPRAVDIGSILICYGVGVKKLVGYFECVSERALRDDLEVRWPYYVEGRGLSKEYSSSWWKYDLKLMSLQEEFIRDNPELPVTYTGTQSLGALNWGSDKIRLSPEFAEFLIGKINECI